jgi:hypothetical protein
MSDVSGILPIYLATLEKEALFQAKIEPFGCWQIASCACSGRPQVVSGDFEIRRPETAAETLSKIIRAHVN